jgi:hypothetical protein
MQKSLKMTPLGMSVWEYVGMREKTPVRPHSHTQPRSASAFSIKVGTSQLRRSSRIGTPPTGASYLIFESKLRSQAQNDV